MSSEPLERRYDRADRDCDLVLKGGVTSGIVYPVAACELATTFRLRRIGGTSSGAIVGAFAAAAECHRQTLPAPVGPQPPLPAGALEPGFEGLETFARQLERDGSLRNVFLPDPPLRAPFDVLFAGQTEQARGWEAGDAPAVAPANGGATRLRGGIRRAAAPLTTSAPLGPARPAQRAFVALLRAVPRRYVLIGGGLAFVAALALLWPTMLSAVAQARSGGLVGRLLGDVRALATIAALVVVTAIGAASGGALGLWRIVSREWIPTFVRNGFGLTRGLGAVTPHADGDGPHALTTWMTRIINELSGRDAMAAPLTFGDLWRAGGAGAGRAIDFQLVTTCVTLGRPLRLPDDLAHDLPLYFDPDEWRLYFPERVVAHCVRHAARGPRTRDPALPGTGPAYYPLPPADDLPVVVATRLSVAFPGVISMTPLWSVDRNTGAGLDGGLPLERCWFSDGGLTSNFPVHFFDQLIPRWPTFAIDLRAAPPGYPIHPHDESRNVWMPRTNDDGRSEWWTRLASDAPDAGDAAGLSAVIGFVGAMLRTMQSWRDTTLARTSGFRDRIAQVKLHPRHEGGLNIAMPPSVIRRIVARGAAAGVLLRERYTITQAALTAENAAEARRRGTNVGAWRPATVSWDNHRWLRYRIAMAALQDALDAMDDAYVAKPGYASLVSRPAGTPPVDYDWDAAQRAADPDRATDALLAAVRAWRTSPHDLRFTAGSLPPARPGVRVWPHL